MQRPHFNNMNIRTFINEYGRPRSGCAAFHRVSIACTSSATVVRIGWPSFATGLRLPHEGAIADLISRILLLVIALSAGYICARFLEGSMALSGLTFIIEASRFSC
jgi:hypothetical protein